MNKSRKFVSCAAALATALSLYTAPVFAKNSGPVTPVLYQDEPDSDTKVPDTALDKTETDEDKESDDKDTDSTPNLPVEGTGSTFEEFPSSGTINNELSSENLPTVNVSELEIDKQANGKVFEVTNKKYVQYSFTVTKPSSDLFATFAWKSETDGPTIDNVDPVIYVNGGTMDMAKEVKINRDSSTDEVTLTFPKDFLVKNSSSKKECKVTVGFKATPSNDVKKTKLSLEATFNYEKAVTPLFTAVDEYSLKDNTWKLMLGLKLNKKPQTLSLKVTNKNNLLKTIKSIDIDDEAVSPISSKTASDGTITINFSSETVKKLNKDSVIEIVFETEAPAEAEKAQSITVTGTSEVDGKTVTGTYDTELTIPVKGILKPFTATHHYDAEANTWTATVILNFDAKNWKGEIAQQSGDLLEAISSATLDGVDVSNYCNGLTFSLNSNDETPLHTGSELVLTCPVKAVQEETAEKVVLTLSADSVSKEYSAVFKALPKLPTTPTNPEPTTPTNPEPTTPTTPETTTPTTPETTTPTTPETTTPTTPETTTPTTPEPSGNNTIDPQTGDEIVQQAAPVIQKETSSTSRSDSSNTSENDNEITVKEDVDIPVDQVVSAILNTDNQTYVTTVQLYNQVPEKMNISVKADPDVFDQSKIKVSVSGEDLAESDYEITQDPAGTYNVNLTAAGLAKLKKDSKIDVTFTLTQNNFTSLSTETTVDNGVYTTDYKYSNEAGIKKPFTATHHYNKDDQTWTVTLILNQNPKSLELTFDQKQGDALKSPSLITLGGNKVTPAVKYSNGTYTITFGADTVKEMGIGSKIEIVFPIDYTKEQTEKINMNVNDGISKKDFSATFKVVKGAPGTNSPTASGSTHTSTDTGIIWAVTALVVAAAAFILFFFLSKKSRKADNK